MELFNTPISSPVLVSLTVIYALVASITTFNIRIEQAKRNKWLDPHKEHVPLWIGAISAFVMWGLWIFIFFLNWKYALLLFIIKFVLKVLPVLEYIGSYLIWPFVGTETASILFEINAQQKQAGRDLRKIEKAKTPEEMNQILDKWTDK